MSAHLSGRLRPQPVRSAGWLPPIPRRIGSTRSDGLASFTITDASATAQLPNNGESGLVALGASLSVNGAGTSAVTITHASTVGVSHIVAIGSIVSGNGFGIASSGTKGSVSVTLGPPGSVVSNCSFAIDLTTATLVGQRKAGFHRRLRRPAAVRRRRSPDGDHRP